MPDRQGGNSLHKHLDNVCFLKKEINLLKGLNVLGGVAKVFYFASQHVNFNAGIKTVKRFLKLN